jgi:hypothetical protein
VTGLTSTATSLPGQIAPNIPRRSTTKRASDRTKQGTDNQKFSGKKAG